MYYQMLDYLRLILLAALIFVCVEGYQAVTAETKPEKIAEPIYSVEDAAPAAETPEEPEVIPTETEYPHTEEDLEHLALVIYQEAGGDKCTDDTRMKVGNVVMNRVADPRYPDTIQGVLKQKRQYGRLHWTGLVWPARASHETEAHAVERAYAIAERILQGERVLPADVIYQAEFPQGTEVVAHQDGFYFCR